MLGKIVHEFIPCAGNSRNSEGAFIEKKNGNILFVYSRFSSEAEDNAFAELWAVESSDGGRNFSGMHPVLTREAEQTYNIMSVSLLRMKNGNIGLFYLIRMGEEEMYCYLRRSSDEGEHFGERILCTPEKPAFFIVNNDRVIRLRSGRILIPAALHRRTHPAGENAVYRLDPFSQVMFYYSDDDGYTFHMSDTRLTVQNTLSLNGLQEPGVLEIGNNVVWCFIRTGMGFYYESYSHDGGNHWTQAERSCFTGPESPLCAKRLSDGRIFVVWNPVPLYNGRSDVVQGVWTGRRTPLVCAFSEGEPRVFSAPLVIENAPDAGYCYTAIHPLRDAVLLAYCSGGIKEGSCLNKMTIRLIHNDEFKNAEAYVG